MIHKAPFEEENDEKETSDETSVDEIVDEFAEDGLDEGADIEVTEIDISAGPADIETGAQDLVDSWQPTTPEGEQYKQELQELLGQFGPTEEEGGELEPEGFGFDIGLMGKEAAKRAMK